ncbi:DUF1735 domain-containing protein [Sphingobacterium puteale]|uniref:DUF1735 domain-containing protein n=1 Tax=Sphingobacterium puteale TaxID=2420510 RepID=A0A420VV51_9SPHI|nr:DUF1735 domain-containing protein [Sphingobacterium puteale]RKO70145.1 DUF1735 domain-containing protein [Sphingobacterium puteale]
MKIITILSFLIALFTCLSCEKIDIPKQEEINNYNLVYMSAATRINNEIILYKDSTYRLTYGASFGGGIDYPSDNVKVDFEVNKDSVGAYNKINGTNYDILPESCFSLSAFTSSIDKNSLSTMPLSIQINPTKGMELFKTYLLPVSIRKIEGNAQINQNLATAYYLITSSLNLADFTDFDRSKWTVSQMSSEEKTGEGNGNGMAIHALDDDFNTFWHTQWNGGIAPAPHYLEIDLGETKVIHGISIVGRSGSNSGRPEVLKVEIRNSNNTAWTVVGEMPWSNNSTVQRQFFSKSYEARQFRITVLKNFNNQPFTHLANLNLF